MSSRSDPLGPRGLFEALRLLTPYDTKSMTKVRVGPNRDGGYVMLDDFAQSGDVVSFGVGTQVEYDAVFADMGKRVFMYDHTIEGLPYRHDNFHFRKLGIGAVNDPASNLFTLDHHLEADRLDDRDDLILKIDVEGAEYDSILATPTTTLRKFRQIVIELHDLLELDQVVFRDRFIAFMGRLLESFTIVHVHGNNHSQIAVVQGHAVVQVLELSLVRSDLIEAEPSTTIYPTQLDDANCSLIPDFLLWFYPFLPMPSDVNRALEASLFRSRKGL